MPSETTKIAMEMTSAAMREVSLGISSNARKPSKREEQTRCSRGHRALQAIARITAIDPATTQAA